MENKELEYLIKGLISRADRLSALYLSVAGLALVVTTLRLQGTEKKFEFSGVHFKLTNFWLVAAAFTVSHIYLAFLFVSACHKFIPLEREYKKIALEKLTYSEAPFIFQDMKLVQPTSTKYKYILDLKNPASILLLGILLLILITIIRVEAIILRQKLFYLFIAYLLLVVNYCTGGWWMIELSKSLNVV